MSCNANLNPKIQRKLDETKPMSRPQATHIQSEADQTGQNQEFKKRVQGAADQQATDAARREMAEQRKDNGEHLV